MKKVLKLAAFGAAVFGVVFFVACKKDVTSNDNVNELQVEKEAFSLSKFEHLRNYESYNPEKEKIGSLIKNFKMAVEQNDVGHMPTQMPLSEALWNIEALLNAKTGHAGCKLSRVHKDFSLSVKLENGAEGVEISLTEMTRQYHLLLEKVEQALAAEPAITKEVVLADVSVIKNDKKELELGLHVVIGVDPQGPFYAWMPPTCSQITQSWHNWTSAGPIPSSCSPNPRPSGSSASDIIEIAASNILFTNCVPNFLTPSTSSTPLWNSNTGYYTSILLTITLGPDIADAINDLSLTNPFRRRFLFKAHPDMLTGGLEACFSPQDLRFYRDGAITVVNRYFANPNTSIPINLSLCELSVSKNYEWVNRPTVPSSYGLSLRLGNVIEDIP
ncbi:MAG: hypothetical protein RL757_822 [Bacteroidota bacterium]|jgi:hypothetical protein